MRSDLVVGGVVVPCPARNDVVLGVLIAAGSLVLFLLRPMFDDNAQDQPIWSYAFPVAAALLLMFRRIRPVVTIISIVSVVVVYLLLVDTPGPMAIPVLIGLYSVASHGDRRTAIMAAACGAILVSIAALTVGDEAPTALNLGVAVLVTIIPILVGDGIRSRRALIAATDERVRLAEESAVQQANQQVLDERVRIARELHDVVAHSIATINVQSGVAAHVIDDEPAAAKEALIEIKESSKSALAELRSMLGVLRDADDDSKPMAPSPGVPEIGSLIDRYVGEITYETVGAPSRNVGPVVGLVAYRIVQESLTNVMKHAAGATVEVRLHYQPESLSLTVADSGGEGGSGAMGAGVGIKGLAERVRAIGGTISAAPRFDAGFEVEAVLPYVPTERSGAAGGQR